MFDKERKDLVVMDFGLARMTVVGSARDTQSGVVIGTPAYMSPEQARGDCKGRWPGGRHLLARHHHVRTADRVAAIPGHRTRSHRPDSLLLEAEPPLRPPVERKPNPLKPPASRTALEKDPRKRFASMKEFAAAIDGYLRQPGSSTAETAKAGRDNPKHRDHRRRG